MRTFRLSVAVVALTVLLSSTTTFAADSGAALQRSDVEAIIKDYLIKNPKVILEAVEEYRKTQEAEAKVKAEKAIKDSATELYKDTVSGATGNITNPDVVMVEFFDYHCGYCKHFLPTIQQLVKEDPKLKVIFKELPILSEDSRLAAKAALAVNKIDPKKYMQYHTALMTMPKESLTKGAFTEANLAAEAKKLGIDEAVFKTTLKDPELDKHLDKDLALAQKLGIQGTPAVIVNDTLFPGAVDISDIKTAIQQKREGKSSGAAADKTP